MATKTFVAKNGLTANTANVYFSQLATDLTPTAGGLILFADSTGKIGTRTEAQIKSDISAGVVETVTAGNGLTGGGTGATVTVTLATPSTLTVGGTNTVGATAHQHAITSSSDTSGGTAAILASDSDGDLKVRDLDTGGDLVVGDDATLKSDSAVLGFGLHTDVTLTHVADTALLLNSSRQLQFGDSATYIHQSTDAALDVVSDGSVNITTGTAGVVLKGTTPKLTIGDADAEDTMIVFDGNATDIRMGIDDSSDLFEIGTGATHATTPAITIDTSQVVNFPNLPKLGGTAITATAAEINYLDITSAGTSEASKAIVTDAQGDIIVPDSDKFGFGAANDMQLYHDATNSYITNKTGALKIATETSGIAVTIGHSTSEVTVGDNLTVTGDLSVLGTTTTVNSTVVSIADPIFELGASGSDDNLDRGIKMKYNSSGAKIAFMGYDDSTGKFVMIPDATDSSSVFSGSAGTLVTNLEGNVTGAVTGNADTATALATPRAIGGVNFDGTAAITPQNITVADESSDTSCFVLFGTAATGDVQPKTGTNLTFNSSSGLLTATGFSGNLTGTLQTASQTNITSVGALDAGSITSNFGAINTGASAISTTGAVTGGSVVITNESTIGSAGDTNSVIIGASGTVALTQNETLIGASNSSVGVAMTKAFSGTIGTSATAAVLTFKAADGTASPTGATNFMGGEIVISLKSGSNYETKKIMIHHDGDPSADGTDVFFTEYATLGTEIGETLATAMGDADGTGLTTNQDKHVQFKITNPSGTDTLQYSGVAHLVEVPGDS